MPELDGKVAIVTGATGALGSAVVTELLHAGTTVLAPVRALSELERLRTNITIGVKLGGIEVDLTDEAAVAQAYADLAGLHGGIDILVNTVGGFGGGQKVADTPWELWQQLLDVNLKTAVLSSKAAIPHLLKRGGGSIINIGTRTATQPGANVAAYGASKRALLGLTEALAAELRSQNVTVNAVLPSTIDTADNRSHNPNADASRWVKPQEIARVIRFLVGPDARIISGASIPVYGQA